MTSVKSICLSVHPSIYPNLLPSSQPAKYQRYRPTTSSTIHPLAKSPSKSIYSTSRPDSIPNPQPSNKSQSNRPSTFSTIQQIHIQRSRLSRPSIQIQPNHVQTLLHVPTSGLRRCLTCSTQTNRAAPSVQCRQSTMTPLSTRYPSATSSCPTASHGETPSSSSSSLSSPPS